MTSNANGLPPMDPYKPNNPGQNAPSNPLNAGQGQPPSRPVSSESKNRRIAMIESALLAAQSEKKAPVLSPEGQKRRDVALEAAKHGRPLSASISPQAKSKRLAILKSTIDDRNFSGIRKNVQSEGSSTRFHPYASSSKTAVVVPTEFIQVEEGATYTAIWVIFSGLGGVHGVFTQWNDASQYIRNGDRQCSWKKFRSASEAMRVYNAMNDAGVIEILNSHAAHSSECFVVEGQPDVYVGRQKLISCGLQYQNRHFERFDDKLLAQRALSGSS